MVVNRKVTIYLIQSLKSMILCLSIVQIYSQWIWLWEVVNQKAILANSFLTATTVHNKSVDSGLRHLIQHVDF